MMPRTGVVGDAEQRREPSEFACENPRLRRSSRSAPTIPTAAPRPVLCPAPAQAVACDRSRRRRADTGAPPTNRALRGGYVAYEADAAETAVGVWCTVRVRRT
jgi:hypothetical protein